MHEDDFTFHGNGNTFTVVRLLICLVTDCWTVKSREIYVVRMGEQGCDTEGLT